MSNTINYCHNEPPSLPNGNAKKGFFLDRTLCFIRVFIFQRNCAVRSWIMATWCVCICMRWANAELSMYSRPQYARIVASIVCTLCRSSIWLHDICHRLIAKWQQWLMPFHSIIFIFYPPGSRFCFSLRLLAGRIIYCVGISGAWSLVAWPSITRKFHGFFSLSLLRFG